MTLMKSLLPILFSVISGLMLLHGCANRRPPLPTWTPQILLLTAPIGPEEIYRIPEGEKIAFGQLIREADSAKVIFVGEAHDQIEHHRIQLRVLQDLLQKGKEVVLAMEMFQRFQQPVLDRWSQGGLTEKEFLKEVRWETTWGIDFDLYKDILDEAKNHRLKVVALNIERELVSKVAEKGIKGLSSEDREKLPAMNLSDEEHRAYIRGIYNRHEGGLASDFERFYESQCLWDEGMAETLSRFLGSSESQGKTVMVLAGNGHIVFDFGIPKRFYQRTPAPFKTIVLKEWSREADQDLSFSSPSLTLADFLWVTRPNPREQSRPRMGIFLKEKGDSGGLWIERVIPNSPAGKAGLIQGDQLFAVEGKEISKVREIHDALARKGWGKDIVLTIIRDGIKKEITVTLPPLKD